MSYANHLCVKIDKLKWLSKSKKLVMIVKLSVNIISTAEKELKHKWNCSLWHMYSVLPKCLFLWVFLSFKIQRQEEKDLQKCNRKQ